MRDIEFRVWDKIEKRMIYANEAINSKDLLAIGLHGLPISVDRDSFKENEIIGWNRDHNLIPMQYTEFKDKNGVKIYEGDIIQLEFGKKWRGKVEFDNGAYTINFGGASSYLCSLCSIDLEKEPFVVIGNIWDNPELLKESDLNEKSDDKSTYEL